jgi:hypothetical protein
MWIQISAEVFWGFRTFVTELESCDSVERQVKRYLKQVLQQENLLALAEQVDTLKLHLHCSVEEAVERERQGETIYMCDCASHPAVK